MQTRSGKRLLSPDEIPPREPRKRKVIPRTNIYYRLNFPSKKFTCQLTPDKKLGYLRLEGKIESGTSIYLVYQKYRRHKWYDSKPVKLYNYYLTPDWEEAEKYQFHYGEDRNPISEIKKITLELAS